MIEAGEAERVLNGQVGEDVVGRKVVDPEEHLAGELAKPLRQGREGGRRQGGEVVQRRRLAETWRLTHRASRCAGRPAAGLRTGRCRAAAGAPPAAAADRKSVV